MAKANHHKTYEPTIANGSRRLARLSCCVFTEVDNFTIKPDGRVEELSNANTMCNVTVYPHKGGIRVSYRGYPVTVFNGVVMT